MKQDHTDPMSAFQSKPRNFGKVITEEEQAKAKEQTEWFEQITFCKWLKNNYPDILFRSDIQSAGKLSPQMQNIKQIIDPFDAWPDIVIYSLNLQIEMKRVGASLSNAHARNQLLRHEQLRKLGWRVVVCFGAEEAKRVFLEYYNGKF